MSNYVCAVGDYMPSDPNEPVMDLLLQQYKRVIVESLITSFGLDFLVQDQYGGDVDTIHNVSQVGRVPEMTYKNARNAAAYKNHGKYDTNEYHRDPRYKEIRVYLRSQKCWDIRQKAPDARRMSAALLHGMQANATRQMGLFGRIEQRWGVFRYTLTGRLANRKRLELCGMPIRAIK